MLIDDRPYVVDGAIATELERRGANLNHPLWSARILVEAPEMIEDLHLDYYLAGADIATTASYQATLAGFATQGIDVEEGKRLLLRSIELAQRARERGLEQVTRRNPLLIAASVGAFGAHRHDRSEYHGNYGVSELTLRDFHCRQVEVLGTGGADLLAFETVPSLLEGEALLRVLEKFPDTPAWVAFSCMDPTHVCHGEDFARCAALANESDAIVAIGVNCTAPEDIEALMQIGRVATLKPLIAYPNRGERLNTPGACQTPSLADYAQSWLKAGARLIGGCCGTSVDDIRKLAHTVDQRRPKDSDRNQQNAWTHRSKLVQ